MSAVTSAWSTRTRTRSCAVSFCAGAATCRKPGPTATMPDLSLPRYTSTPGLSADMSGTWPGSTPNSPSAPGAVTSSTSVSTRAPRGVVSENFITKTPRPSASLLLRFLLELLGLGAHVVDAALHVEGLLRQVVALAVDDLLEAGNGVLD